ncbi:MAG: flagellar basal-body rod protein FlgG [Pirellulales bacterium]
MSVQTLYTAATGMQAMQTKLEVIANNMANVNTTAFKKDRANFEDLFYDHQVMPGNIDANQEATPTGTNVGLGVRVSSVQTDFKQGGFNQTDRSLDMLIEGGGFFQVEDPSGEVLYTRAGNFSVNANGEVVTGSAGIGRKLTPAIVVPPDAVDVGISLDGIVTARIAGQSDPTELGTIELAKFINPEGLLKLGENLYSATNASSTAVTGAPNTEGMGTIRSGMLEASNVEPVKELIDLITTQRSFEMNSQTIKAGDEMLQLISSLGR